MRLLEIDNQEEMVAILERAFYEVQCRRNIINFMINDGMNNTENFQGRWAVDFNTREIKLYD